MRDYLWTLLLANVALRSLRKTSHWKRQKSRDPELYLKKVKETELKEGNVDFETVSVGANDVTDLNLNENDFTTLNNWLMKLWYLWSTLKLDELKC